MKYGNFDMDSREFIVTSPKTPRAFDNFIFNDAIVGNVEQTGVGYTDYQVEDKEMTKLTTGIGRTCDFDVFGREEYMNRLVYVRDNETGEYWNIGWEPVKKDYDTYRCRHGVGYSIIENETAGVRGALRIFVPQGKDPVEIWSLKLEDTSGQERDLSVFVYAQVSFSYMWEFDSYGDVIYRNSLFDETHQMMVFSKHPFIQPHSYQTGFLCIDSTVDGFDGSKDAFVGRYSSMNEPEAVVEGRCRNSAGTGGGTVAAIQTNLTIGANEFQEVHMVMGVSDTVENCVQLRDKYLNDAEHHFEALKKDKDQMVQSNFIETPDEILNNMANVWNKQQASYGAYWCRWGWMGYRDVVQHGYGVSNFDSEKTREIILKAMAHKYQSGLALRGWNPVDKKAYSDSALWLVYTLIAYLKETGDYDLLNEVVPYFDEGSDTVMDHIKTSLNFLENNKGSHGLLLIKFGDWNDSLTGIGKEGRGESVWLSMAYAYALQLMNELFEYLGEEDNAKEYHERRMSIIKAINEEAWDGEWYIRGYDDNGAPIGASENTEGQIYLNVQSWAMICGAAKGERVQQILNSVDKYLQTDVGYQLIHPTYKTFDPMIGRVTSMEPGICENGTIYSHGNAFMIKGLYDIGEKERAYEVYKKVTPAYVANDDDVKNSSPSYVYANCYYGPEHRNSPYQVEFTWVTGSIAWFHNLLYEDMIGVARDHKGITIKPQMPDAWPQMSSTRTIRDKTFQIEISRDEKTEQMLVTFNGKERSDSFIAYDECLEVNRLQIILPV